MDALIGRISNVFWSPPPLPLPAPSSKTELCPRCKKIDLESIFHPARPVPSEIGVPISIIGAIDGRSECPLCCLFAAVHFQGLKWQEREGFHLRLYSIPTLLGEERPEKGWPGVGLSVIRGTDLSYTAFPETNSYMDNTNYTDKGFILPTVQMSDGKMYRTSLVGCQINAESVSYARIKKWLSECQSLHSKTCSLGESSLPVQLKCIDCDTRQIHRIEFRDEYVCLSYVWGALNQRSPDHIGEDRSRLPSYNVPRVIEDAMIVVKALGMRYLWVDRYCIDQTDHDSKDLQIQNMDRIYEGAHLTIIASAGSNSAFGLPGVSHTPRKAQPSAFTDKGVFVSSLPPLANALRDSAWIRRGWTYQEAIVSRRCLFFTDIQVYFVCRSMTCSESIIREASLPTASTRIATTTLRADLFGRSGALASTKYSQLRQLADHITEYSGRELTYQEDALNAFRGLLTRSPFPTYFGIPIAATDHPEDMDSEKPWNIGFAETDWNIGLARGLYWTPQFLRFYHRTHLTRRPGFPSWSWAGWKGAVEYCSKGGPNTGPSGDEELMEVDREHFETKIWVEGNDGTVISWEDLVAFDSRTKMMRELSTYLGLEAWVYQLRFQACGHDIRVCACHSTSKHEGKWLAESSIGRVYSNEVSAKGSELFQRLTTELWDCILLFHCIRYPSILYNLLIIEYIGDSVGAVRTAQRVGTVTIRQTELNDIFKNISKEKKRVRLG
ncbi:HET-domain-containing protein [Stipitochalara longipes BDJ]|nr:HET-domain-containing protein [Stipitochalara longipes BDJ]